MPLKAIALAATALFCSRPAMAVDRLTLYAGESKVIAEEGAGKLLVGNKAVVDAKVLSSDEVLLNGKSVGMTSLMVWDRHGEKHSYEIEVLAGSLKKTLIEIDVQVLEISDAANWDVGIDWAAALAGQAPLAAGLPGAPTQVLEQNPGLLTLGTFARGPLGARLDLLVQKNKARVVAKPRLMTVSGSSARFLSGGQVPVAQQDDKGRASTQYKDYGVSLDIKPTADEEGNVNASIRAEMSDIDPTNSVTVGGGVLPAIKTRWVETNIFVKKDGTLVIAGLLQETEGKVTKGVPLLSEIPVLGELFKHTDYVRKNSELVIFVSPKVLGL